jgi:hypothetical protein
MDATPPTSRSRWLLAIVASTAIVLLVAPAAARGPCPGEAPVPWTGPTLYSGGFHFAALGGVSPSIALFRRLNDLPDLQWPERIFFYPTSWLGDAWPVPSAPVQPSAEEKLRWAAESALSGDVSMFEPYRPPDPWRATYEPLPAIELDLSTAPGAPLDWWLAPTEEYAGSPRPQAVYRLARQIELVDWLQTPVTASHASWVFEWGFVPPTATSRRPCTWQCVPHAGAARCPMGMARGRKRRSRSCTAALAARRGRGARPTGSVTITSGTVTLSSLDRRGPDIARGLRPVGGCRDIRRFGHIFRRRGDAWCSVGVRAADSSGPSSSSPP